MNTINEYIYIHEYIYIDLYIYKYISSNLTEAR